MLRTLLTCSSQNHHQYSGSLDVQYNGIPDSDLADYGSFYSYPRAQHCLRDINGDARCDYYPDLTGSWIDVLRDKGETSPSYGLICAQARG